LYFLVSCIVVYFMCTYEYKLPSGPSVVDFKYINMSHSSVSFDKFCRTSCMHTYIFFYSLMLCLHFAYHIVMIIIVLL